MSLQRQHFSLQLFKDPKFCPAVVFDLARLAAQLSDAQSSEPTVRVA